MDDLEITVARLCDRVENNERQHAELVEIVKDEKRRLNHNLEKITARLDDLNAMIGAYRLEARHSIDSKPTWGTTVALTTLVGAVVGLATFLLTH